MATLQPTTSTTLSFTETDPHLPLLSQSFLFSLQGTQEDYAHQLLELNGLACQLNHLLQHSSDDLCAQSAVGVVIPNDLTAVEAYQFGKKVGQQEYQQFVALTHTQEGESLPEQLLVLVDWWSQSYLAHYGQLLIDDTRELDPYISLAVIGMSNIKLKKIDRQPGCAFYAGIISGFFSELGGSELDVIEPDCRDQEVNICRFILGPQGDLNARHFWQTVDVAF